MMQYSLQQLSYLDGKEIIRWVATEMAFTGGGFGIGWRDSENLWQEEHEEVVWAHPSVPYLQFISVHIQLSQGKPLCLLAQCDDGTGFYGLDLYEVEEMAEPSTEEALSIYRTREVLELPLGRAKVAVRRRDGPNAVIEANISIDGQEIKLLAGEVYPRDDGEFDIVEGDDSILIQLGGVLSCLSTY